MRKGLTCSQAGKLGYAASASTIKANYLYRVEKYNTAPNICKNCAVPLSYDSRFCKFCSSKCSATFNNRDKPKKRRACKNCGAVCKARSSFFCSSACFERYRRDNKKKEIERLGVFASNRQARIFLSEKFGRKCSICEVVTWNGSPVPLVADHVDGNSCNNSVGNIRLVCCNCDALLPTYKGRNRGNGRFKRLERYRQGKSF